MSELVVAITRTQRNKSAIKPSFVVFRHIKKQDSIPNFKSKESTQICKDNLEN